MEEKVNKKYFIIAEISAFLSFVLNTICVFTARRGTSFSPAWIPEFGVVYWLKTILAIVGLCYFFNSKVFTAKEIPRYISIFTLVILLYSIPVINTAIIILTGTFFLMIRGSNSLEYEDRIPIQVIWLIPLFIIAVHFVISLVKIRKRN